MKIDLLTTFSILTISTYSFSSYAAQKPNVLIIIADDMGFSDLGCYGSEIKTPHIDYLASEGVLFSGMRNVGRSCPSRAALLTGRYQHSVGLGWMTETDEHRSGYRGEVSRDIPTMPEVFKMNGYSTYMAGKWHITAGKAIGKRPLNGSFPNQRGFDKYWGAVNGGGGYYNPKNLMSDTTDISFDSLPDDFYYTNCLNQKMVEYIKKHDTEEPAFMYLAHYAPHRPLEAPKERVDAIKARYEVGYDILKRNRYENMQKLGLISEDIDMPIHDICFDNRAQIVCQSEKARQEWIELALPYNNKRPSWDELSTQIQQSWVEEMATFAAMIEIMDEGIGDVISALKENGMYDNTLIIFISDNGATLEGGFVSQLAADLSNTPFRDYKQWAYNGSTMSPFIMRFPSSMCDKQKNEVITGTFHQMDVFPTCVEFASLDYPQEFNNKPIDSLHGVSLMPLFEEKSIEKRDLFFEHQTASAVISENWKLVRISSKDRWELYNLCEDIFEENNLADKYPQKVIELEKKWNNWAKLNDVLPLETLNWTQRVEKNKKLYPEDWLR
ncbi:MAG: sulfatase-like hydrolase/transferase [Rikenellaceae bacterium]